MNLRTSKLLYYQVISRSQNSISLSRYDHQFSQAVLRKNQKKNKTQISLHINHTKISHIKNHKNHIKIFEFKIKTLLQLASYEKSINQRIFESITTCISKKCFWECSRGTFLRTKWLEQSLCQTSKW